jgi:hypothetical protein
VKRAKKWWTEKVKKGHDGRNKTGRAFVFFSRRNRQPRFRFCGDFPHGGLTQMPVEDVEMVRAVRREMARRSLDCGEAQVCAMRGVIHLTGRVRPIKGHENEFEEEIHVLHRVLKQKTGVRDVVMEWSTGEHKVDMSRHRRSTAG